MPTPAGDTVEVIDYAEPSNHRHACVACGHAWDCFELKVFAKCDTTKAAKVNRDGPYCLLCRSLQMALNAADVRGMAAVQEAIRKVQRRMNQKRRLAL